MRRDESRYWPCWGRRKVRTAKRLDVPSVARVITIHRTIISVISLERYRGGIDSGSKNPCRLNFRRKLTKLVSVRSEFLLLVRSLSARLLRVCSHNVLTLDLARVLSLRHTTLYSGRNFGALDLIIKGAIASRLYSTPTKEFSKGQDTCVRSVLLIYVNT